MLEVFRKFLLFQKILCGILMNSLPTNQRNNSSMNKI